MDLALGLGIRTPRIKRIITTELDERECVQFRVAGTTLEDAWPDLGWFRTICLAFQLRWAIRKMRKLTSPTAGSLESGLCRSLWMEEDYYGLPSTPGRRSHRVLDELLAQHEGLADRGSKDAGPSMRHPAPAPSPPSR